MIFATALVGLAFWQAQVAAAKETVVRHKSLPPPVKTKRSVRPVETRFTGDPLMDYAARCKNGISWNDILGTIQDFKNAGLDQNFQSSTDSLKEIFTLRSAQQKWYHDALVDGLRLSSKQSTQVAANLDGRLTTAKAELVRAISEIPSIQDQRNQEALTNFTDPSQWLLIDNGNFKPWNLCQLYPEQEKLTWRYFESVPEQPAADRFRSIAEAYSPLRILAPPSQFVNEESGKYYNHGILPPPFLPANAIFPLVDAQQHRLPKEGRLSKSGSNTNQDAFDLIVFLQTLHPAQFKIYLLLRPGGVTTIPENMKEIDKALK